MVAEKGDLGREPEYKKDRSPGPKSAIDSMFGKPVDVDDVGERRNPASKEWNTGRHRTSVHNVVQGFGEWI